MIETDKTRRHIRVRGAFPGVSSPSAHDGFQHAELHRTLRALVQCRSLRCRLHLPEPKVSIKVTRQHTTCENTNKNEVAHEQIIINSTKSNTYIPHVLIECGQRHVHSQRRALTLCQQMRLEHRRNGQIEDLQFDHKRVVPDTALGLHSHIAAKGSAIGRKRRTSPWRRSRD